ncbi:MAG: putative lipid II flippase FtsW [Acidimicrobiales bacterium]
MTLLGLIITLNLIGLVMVMSASSVVSLEDHDTSWYYFQRQAAWAAIGTVCMLVTQRIDYHRWSRLAGTALAGSIALLAAVLVPGVGVNVNGATRWIGYGPVVIQPSEVAKLGLLLFCASLLGRRITKVHRTELTLRPVLVVSAVVIGLVMAQPNLGTSIVLGTIVLALLFVAGTSMRPLGLLAGTAAVLAVIGALAAPYRRARVLAFLHPESDPQGTGYQTLQAWMAMAEGGVNGVGVGASRAKWGFLPFAHTDFIFAIIAEELGFLGAAVVILLFVALAVVGIRTAFAAPDAFGMLLAAGITAWFVVQAFVNIGAVVGVLPITGVPLPFVSSGGSSLVTSMTACGLLLSVARQARPLRRSRTTAAAANGRGDAKRKAAPTAKPATAKPAAADPAAADPDGAPGADPAGASGGTPSDEPEPAGV